MNEGVFLGGNLHGMPVDEIARTLVEGNVPFQSVSGRDHLPGAFGDVAVLAKPFAPHQLVDAAIRLAALPVRATGEKKDHVRGARLTGVEIDTDPAAVIERTASPAKYIAIR
jgi:hypothetical protein